MAGMTPPTVEEIKTEVLANPGNRLALSLHRFGFDTAARDKGLVIVHRFVRATDPASLNGDLAMHMARFNRAQDILDGKTPIYGMSLFNLQCNLGDYEDEDLCGWVPDREARDIVAAILAAVPGLAAEVAALEPVTLF